MNTTFLCIFHLEINKIIFPGSANYPLPETIKISSVNGLVSQKNKLHDLTGDWKEDSKAPNIIFCGKPSSKIAMWPLLEFGPSIFRYPAKCHLRDV